jgi:uncharacterized damage-inducible protein DinB
MNNPTNGHQNDLIQPILEVLDQGERLLSEISDDAYTHKIPTAFSSSIGGHYRHCLDHFRILLDAVKAGGLNYDHRERDTLIENDRYAALNATRELRKNWSTLEPGCLGRALEVTCKVSYAAGDSQKSISSVSREIMYVVAHAVHHYALIGIMGVLMDLKLPAGFGVAPSTLKHQQATAKSN